MSLCRDIFLLHCCVLALVSAGICKQQGKNGATTRPLKHPAVASLLPSQPCHASLFILNFSPHGCQKVHEGLYCRPSRSPCLCWGVVWQSMVKLGTREAFFRHWLPCAIYPAHGGTFTLQTVCACYRTQGGIIIRALRSNVQLHYPAVKQSLVSWGSVALWTWTSVSEQHHTFLSRRHANASDIVTSNKVLQKSIASCL